MKRSIALWQLVGFAATVSFGTLLHFLYEWTDKSVLAAPFSNVNESTWEHMKLLFYPTFIFAIIQSFFFKERKDFWHIKLKGIILGLALIPAIFYIFNGVIGDSPDWVNIAIFVISVAATYIYEMRLFKKNSSIYMTKKSSIATLCVIFLLFVLFTFAPLKIGIFEDPTTNTYGIE